MESQATVQKYVGSLELLSRGIELYLRGDSYYSALHLAGAAEEVLAVYVRDLPADSSSGVGSVSDQLKEAFLAMSETGSPTDTKALEKWFHDRTYAAKNSVKHKFGRNDHVLDFPPQQEAAELLELAVSTYFQLFSRTGIPYLSCIEAFDEKRRTEKAKNEA